MKKILIVDDEDKIRHILQIMLEQKGYKTEQASNGEEALKLLKDYHYSMVITDLKMPVMDGMTLLREIKKIDPDYPVIVLTAYGSIESAVEAIKEGALDYIAKPFEEEKILITIERSIRFSELIEEKKIHQEELSEFYDFNSIIAESQQMLQVLKQAALVAKSPDTTVLVLGESGTGKELIARTVHYNSARSAKKFLAINSAAIQPTLIESELFGHEKGSFTGADKTKAGKFEIANEGTIFLDEIGDLPIDAQAKLLRFLQEKEFERVGGTKTIRSDVRILGATNKDLMEMVKKGNFRDDLYYRVNVFPLKLPPLRERRKDIMPLASHFLHKFAKSMGKSEPHINEEATRMLFNYSWPGNIRELQNAIERAVILSGDGQIGREHLSFLMHPGIELAIDDKPFTLPHEGINIDEVELDFVKQALQRTNNNQTEAAKVLGLTRGKFRSLIKRLSNEDNQN